MKNVELYRNPASMDPLIPTYGDGELAELSREIFIKSGSLSSRLHPITQKVVASIVCEMNSYYSNLIEGHRTYPKEIEQALHQQLSSDPQTKERQQLGLAHLIVEKKIDQRLENEPDLRPTSAEFIRWIHREFYEQLPESMRIVKDKSDRTYPIIPGEFRDYQVDVGLHQPPDFKVLDHFLERFDHFYGGPQIIATRSLVATAAAHHRLLWIHPFGDGNGRVIRLFSRAQLTKLAKVSGHGLWTLSRGLARKQSEYYELLQAGDQPRQGSLDGRGNLSDKALFNFVRFFLTVIIDQIDFMDGLLNLEGLEYRITQHIASQNTFGKHNDAARNLISEALRRGEVARGEATRITGKAETTARGILKKVEEAGYLISNGSHSPFRIALPAKLHDAYFPQLFMPPANG